MPYEHGGDKMCVILGVSQQPKRLYDWKKALCNWHAGMDFYTKTVLVYNRSPCNALHCIALRIRAINRKDFHPKTKDQVFSQFNLYTQMWNRVRFDAVLCHSIEQQCPNTCKLKMWFFVTIEHCYAVLGPKSKSVGIQHCSQFGVDIILSTQTVKLALLWNHFSRIYHLSEHTISVWRKFTIPFTHPWSNSFDVDAFATRTCLLRPGDQVWYLSSAVQQYIFKMDYFSQKLAKLYTPVTTWNNKKDYAYFIQKQLS